jgi:acyl carrier protein
MAGSEIEADVVLNALYGVLEELNEDRAPEDRLAPDPGTLLYGKDGNLDSLDLVRLVVLYEQAINEATDASICISDDRAMSEHNSHFRTVRSIADYVMQLLREEAGND